MQLVNKKLKLLSFFLIGLFFITNVYAKKFPDGYPECWQDPENPINQNFVTSDVNKNNLGQNPNIFCPLNSKLGHKFFLVDFTSPLEKAQIASKTSAKADEKAAPKKKEAPKKDVPKKEGKK